MKTEILVFCMICCVLVMLLKQYHKAFGILAGIAVCAAVLMTVLPQAERILQTAENIYLQSRLEQEYFQILCKAVGISWLTQLAGDLCRDCGETAIASAAELCGRILLTLLALPLFLTLAETVLEMMQV